MPGQAQDRVPYLFVAHRDKGNLEIHYIVAREWIREDGTTRGFNVAPVGKGYLQMKDDFVSLVNHDFGYDQIIADPLTVQLSQFDRLPKQTDRTQKKAGIAKAIKGLILKDQIRNREELVDFLRDHGNVTRTGRDYISFKLHGQDKPIRFKGEMFKEGADYLGLKDQYKAFKKESAAGRTLTPQQAQDKRQRLDLAVAALEQMNLKTYRVPKQLGRMKKGTVAVHPVQTSQPKSPVLETTNHALMRPAPELIEIKEPPFEAHRGPVHVSQSKATKVHSKSFRAVTGLPPVVNMCSKVIALTMSIGHANLQLLSLIAQKSSLSWFKLTDMKTAQELDRLIFEIKQQIETMEATREQTVWLKMIATQTQEDKMKTQLAPIKRMI